MKSYSSTSMQREKLRLIYICMIAVVVAFICTLWMMNSIDRTELKKTQLFWNGYAKLFYESTGSWFGLEDRLQHDRYMISGHKSLSIIVYDKDAVTEIATLVIKQNTNKDARKIAVLSNGSIVGYTQVSTTAQKLISMRMVLSPLLFAMLIYSIGLWVIQRSHNVKKQTERRIAALIWERASLSANNCLDGDKQLTDALDQIDGLVQRVERLETVRRTMVADIAHELRTPIAVMRTQLDHAIQEGLPLPLARTVSLHDETLRLTKLVRDLQELSLAESGHLSLSKSWFSFTALAAAVAETLVVQSDEHTIQATVHMEHDIRIYADEARIRQIIINLIGNALQHARHELRIELSLEAGYAELTIIDDGLGIEEEELAFVFDRFYRGAGQARASKRGSGLGLGLAIAKQFAHAHSGTLDVSSSYGKGAAFTLSLPIIKD